MKSRWFYESIAAILALAGALAFGFAIFPWINPIQYELEFGNAMPTASIVSLPISIAIMWFAWRLTRKAQRLKLEEESKSQ